MIYIYICPLFQWVLLQISRVFFWHPSCQTVYDYLYIYIYMAIICDLWMSSDMYLEFSFMCMLHQSSGRLETISTGQKCHRDFQKHRHLSLEPSSPQNMTPQAFKPLSKNWNPSFWGLRKSKGDWWRLDTEIIGQSVIKTQLCKIGTAGYRTKTPKS